MVGQIDKEIAVTLKWMKDQLGLKDHELGRRIGCTSQYVNMLINGKVPIPSRMRLRLAQAFQIQDVAVFIRTCIIGELERDAFPKDLFLHLVHEPLLRPGDQGEVAEPPGGPRHPGRPGSVRPTLYPPKPGESFRDFRFSFPAELVEAIIHRVLSRLPSAQVHRRKALEDAIDADELRIMEEFENDPNGTRARTPKNHLVPIMCIVETKQKTDWRVKHDENGERQAFFWPRYPTNNLLGLSL